MKLTKKQIKIIIGETKKELKGTQRSIRRTLGIFSPYGANWGYVAGWDYENNLIVTLFGEVL